MYFYFCLYALGFRRPIMAEVRQLFFKREHAKNPVKAKDDLLKLFRVATCWMCNPVYHHCIRDHSCMYEPYIAEATYKEEINKLLS